MSQYDDESGQCLNALIADELVEIFKEADHDHDGRPRQPDKEENGKEMHHELQESDHRTIVNPRNAEATAFATSQC